MEQGAARSRVVFGETRGVTTADAATGDVEVVARRATRDAAQLDVAHRRARVGLRSCESRRESGVAFGALFHAGENQPRPLVRHPENLFGQIFDSRERAEERAPFGFGVFGRRPVCRVGRAVRSCAAALFE